MNPIEKNNLLQKIDLELKHLDSLKSEAFKNFLVKNDRLKELAHREFDRISNKMNGIFLIRGLITGCASVECYQERTNNITNHRTLNILSSDSIKQARN